jgi:hypothetical protein
MNMTIEIPDFEHEPKKGVVIETGQVVTILRKQRGRYLVEFNEGGLSYWYSRDKIREV